MDNQQFIQTIIIPSVQGFLDKDLLSVMLDLDGHIIIATNRYARIWGYDSYQELVGKNTIDLYQGPQDLELIKKLNYIRQQVIREEKVCTYLSFIIHPDGLAMTLNYHYPIFNPNGEVIATRNVSKQVSVFNHSIELTHFFKPKNRMAEPAASIDKKRIKLTKREKEILYLLTMGLSQLDAANYLGITRGTLAKILTEKICTQFEIEGTNTKLLVKKVIACKYFAHIPKSLLKPRVVIINNDFDLLVGY